MTEATLKPSNDGFPVFSVAKSTNQLPIEPLLPLGLEKWRVLANET